MRSHEILVALQIKIFHTKHVWCVWRKNFVLWPSLRWFAAVRLDMGSAGSSCSTNTSLLRLSRHDLPEEWESSFTSIIINKGDIFITGQKSHRLQTRGPDTRLCGAQSLKNLFYSRNKVVSTFLFFFSWVTDLEISKTLQLTAKLSRWMNRTTDQRRNMYFWFWATWGCWFDQIWTNFRWIFDTF